MCTLLLCVLSLTTDPAAIDSWTLYDATVPVVCVAGQCAAAGPLRLLPVGRLGSGPRSYGTVPGVACG